MTGAMESLARFDPLAAHGGDQGVTARRRFAIVDVFTDVPLTGNQLGVFTDARGLSRDQMQRLTRELNFSECVFVLAPERGGDARVRIFTPASELPFAGHPVLGSAIVLGSALGQTALTLETGSGLIALELHERDGRIASGWMRQPVPTFKPYEREAELLDALGGERSLLPIEEYANGPRHVLVQLDGDALAALRPNMPALAALAAGVSCFAGSGRRWKTRYFAPGLGVLEDPATGSAAGPLAVHVSRHGRVGFGEQLEIRQGAELGRPSLLYARVEGAPSRIDSVQVGGSAVIVAAGEFIAA